MRYTQHIGLGGVCPGIHDLFSKEPDNKAWTLGTSPRVTKRGNGGVRPDGALHHNALIPDNLF
jgi:hypothetical protein